MSDRDDPAAIKLTDGIHVVGEGAEEAAETATVLAGVLMARDVLEVGKSLAERAGLMELDIDERQSAAFIAGAVTGIGLACPRNSKEGKRRAAHAIALVMIALDTARAQKASE